MTFAQVALISSFIPCTDVLTDPTLRATWRNEMSLPSSLTSAQPGGCLLLIAMLALVGCNREPDPITTASTDVALETAQKAEPTTEQTEVAGGAQVQAEGEREKVETAPEHAEEPTSPPEAKEESAEESSEEDATEPHITAYYKSNKHSLKGLLYAGHSVRCDVVTLHDGTFASAKVSFGKGGTHYFTVPLQYQDDLLRFIKSIDALAKEEQQEGVSYLTTTLRPQPGYSQFYYGHNIELRKKFESSISDDAKLAKTMAITFAKAQRNEFEAEQIDTSFHNRLIRELKADLEYNKNTYHLLVQREYYEPQWMKIDLRVLREALAQAAEAVGLDVPEPGVLLLGELKIKEKIRLLNKKQDDEAKSLEEQQQAEAELPEYVPPVRKYKRVSGKPLNFLPGAKHFQFPGSAFRPRWYSYPRAGSTLPVFGGDTEGYAWGGFPSKARYYEYRNTYEFAYKNPRVPFGSLWSMRSADLHQTDDGLLLEATSDERMVDDIIVSGKKIVQMTSTGELRVVAEWKPEYLDKLFPFGDAPPHVVQKFFDTMAIARRDDHIDRETEILNRFLREDVYVRDLLNNGKRRSEEIEYVRTDPRIYPWGSVGLMKLGKTFYAFSYHEGYNYVVDLATGKSQKLEKLFGVGTGYVPIKELRAAGLTRVLASADDGLISQRVSRYDDDLADYVKIALDGKEEVLARDQPWLQVEARYDEYAVVRPKKPDASRLLGVLRPNGTVRWLDLPITDLKKARVYKGTFRDYVRSLWIVTPPTPDNAPYREIGVEFDASTGELKIAWDFQSPRNHAKYSTVESRSAWHFRSPFDAGGKRWFFEGRDHSFNVFDFKTGFLQDKENRARSKNLERLADMRTVNFSHRLATTKWNSEGTPELEVFDSDNWQWRRVQIANDEQWQKVTASPGAKWSPLLHTPHGVWLGTPIITAKKRLGHSVIFVPYAEKLELARR